MRLMLVSLSSDYNNPHRGPSFEHINFYNYLNNIMQGNETCGINKNTLELEALYHYDFGARAVQMGVHSMSADLFLAARKWKPDALLFISFDAQINPLLETFNRINDLGIKTIHWGCDDDYRWEKYTIDLIPHFWGMITTYWQVYDRMKAMSVNVLKSQWAANPFVYMPIAPKPINPRQVFFYGQVHSNRRYLLEKIKQSGIYLKTVGYNDTSAVIPIMDLVREISNSTIVINPSMNQNGMQIKGRHFETPACKVMQVTDFCQQPENSRLPSSDGNPLQDYFMDNEDIIFCADPDDMIFQIEYFLEHIDYRNTIAQSAYDKIVNRHTWGHRFFNIFNWCKGEQPCHV
jgi:spore maturation protein CgeB